MVQPEVWRGFSLELIFFISLVEEKDARDNGGSFRGEVGLRVTVLDFLEGLEEIVSKTHCHG
jgi:hypothetical protein